MLATVGKHTCLLLLQLLPLLLQLLFLLSLAMELLACLGVVDEDLSRLELRPLLVSVAAHAVHELLGALLVQHAEGTP